MRSNNIRAFMVERGAVPARFFAVAMIAVILFYLGVVLILLLSAEQAVE